MQRATVDALLMSAVPISGRLQARELAALTIGLTLALTHADDHANTQFPPACVCTTSWRSRVPLIWEIDGGRHTSVFFVVPLV